MMESFQKPHRVLFVCMGNICRSPAAEIIFRKLASDAGRAGEFEIDSAGTISYHHGAPPDERMAATLQRHGYHVTGRSRKVTAHDLVKFDLILTMDEDNLVAVQRMDSNNAHHHKIRPFVEFCSHGMDLRVPDPYYGGQRGFDHVMTLLEDGCQGILEHFAPVKVAG